MPSAKAAGGPLRCAGATLLCAITGAFSCLGAAGSVPGATSSFARPAHYKPQATTIRDLAVGDVNRDGRSDVVVGGNEMSYGFPGETSVLLAGPRGRLLPSQPLQVPAGGGVAIGDLTGDGNRDVVRAGYFVSGNLEYGEVTVLAGDGRGAFPTRKVTRTKCCPEDIAAGDFNGDRRRDLALVNRDGGYLLLGDGQGGFRRGQAIRRGSSVEAVAADLNRDRKLDLVVLYGAEEPHDVAVHFGNGKGGFSSVRKLSAPGGVSAFAVGRFDRDRWSDIALVSTLDIESRRQRLVVMQGTRTGRFRSKGVYGIGRYPKGYINHWRLIASDLNRDRRQDLVLVGPVGLRGENTVRVLGGRGDGSFRRVRTLAHCCTADIAEVGFVDRDRKPDFVTVSARGGSAPETYHQVVSVLLNTTR